MEEGALRLNHGPEEQNHDDKRMTHNMMEKRRKDRIKQWISHIAQLLPPASSQGPDKPSTLDIMERAANYIIELKASYEKLLTEQGDAVLVEEMHKMRTELDSVRAERDRLSEVLNAAGIAALNDTSQWRGNRKSNSALTENGTSPATAASDSTNEVAMANGSDESRSKSKSSITSSSKRRNTISVHLEQQKLQQEQQQQQQQQAMAQAMASGFMSHNSGYIYSGLPGQNLMVNSNLMVSPSGQVVVSANHQTSLTAGSASSALDGGQRDNVVYGLEKSSQSAVRGGNANMLGGGSIGGLLQIAMQDAGITPSLQLDASRQSSPAPVSELNVHTDSGATESDISRPQAQQQSLSLEDVSHDALQTLASVASNTVSSSMSLFPSLASSAMMGMMQSATGSASLAASTVTVTSSAMNQNTPIMSVGQLGQLHQQQPSQASLVMGMPVLNHLASNAGLGMVAQNAGQNPGAMGIMPSGTISQHGQLSMIQGAAGPGGLVPGSILMNQQGQLLMINENGLPILMQHSLDPSLSGLGDKTVIGSGGVSVSNSGLMGGANPTISLFDHQQQALISSGALTIAKSDPGASGNLSSVQASHPQSSILAGMNPQNPGQMSFLGSQLLSQGPLQSLAVQSGGQLGSLLQPGAAINQQLMQSLGLGFPGMLTGANAGGGVTNPTNQAQHTIAGGATAGAAATAGGQATAGGVLFPGAQGSSMVTLNTVPANPHQLPSALVLPSGHVIPVVSNPQLLTANHGGGGLMSVAPGGSGGLTGGSAGATGHIQLQQMGGGAGASQVIQVDPNNPGGAQVFIGPNGLQMTTTAAGQAHLTQQQQIQQLLQQQQNLNLLMPSAAISASQTIPTTTVVTLASTVVPASAAKNVLAKAQMQTTQVLMQRNASQQRTHTTSAIARKGSQNVKTSSSETQTSSSNASGMLMQTGCSGTGSTGSVQLTAAGGSGCTTGANSSNGAAAGSAPILLMMQHNGQVVNVLVDPITLQVLNSGQTAVQTTPSIGGAVSTTVGDKSGASSSVHTSVASSSSKKSNKKNSQRTTTPKPKSSKSSSKASSTSTTSTTTSSCSQTVMSRTNATCSVTTSVTQPLVINTDGPWDSQAASNIMICDDTNNPASEEGGLAPSSDNQDILAKAAQSIFTASPTEMTSPIGGAFYNPAHDDNPLLIDTSPAGPDTDMPSSSSPKKSISTNATPQTELSKSVDCQQQREQHSQMLQEQEALLRQQEQQEQEKLMQQEREQHEQLMRHIEQQQQMGLTSPQTLSLIPPSMPSLAQTSDVGTLSAAVAVTTADSSAAATNTISSGTDTAGQIVPPPKKPKKSKSKKKDKEKEDGREKDGDGSKSSKKSSKKKKREQEAAIRRQEEINQQQQLILQQQQQQQEEQAKLQHHEQEQLLLLQQHQQQQEQQSPGLMSEPQLVQPSAADMIVDEVADHVVSGATDPFVLPDSITFTESEISDVLDQVEKLGSSLVSDEQLKKYEKVEKAEKREKKSKRRKDVGQMDDGSSNPNKKQCKGNSRENDSSIEANLFVLNQQLGVRPLSQQQQQDDPNSSSRMSIYDFQDDSPPGLGSAKTESPPKSKSKKSKSKTPSGTQNLLAATSPLSVSTVSTTSAMVTNAAATTTLASATTTTSAGTNTPASSLDMLVPALSQAKSDSSSSVSKGSKSSKSKKSDKKDRAKSNSASSIADSLNNMNAVNSVHSISATARVNTAASENMSIQTNGTISSSKSNDSLSSNSVDSASVILPMPGFDTLEALNSPPPLISPPVSQAKSSGSSSGSKGQGQLQDQNLDGSLGQISSIVSSDIVTTMCSTSIETLADISDVVSTSNTMNIEPLMLQSSNSPPPALHHPLTLGHNSANSMMVQQQQKQKQQQQQSISNKQRQQTPPRHNPAQQMPSHSPQMAQPPQSGPTQGHAHMGPPTSPAQAVGRPRSTSLSHQQQQNQGGYLSSSPQGGAGVRQSPSASCISPSSSHSRGSHDNQGFSQGAGAHMAPTQSPSSSVRLNDMSSLLNSPDIPCPNANLFSSSAPKLSHMQKPTSQGKPSCTEDSSASRSRTGIYSADNFVQPSRQTSNLESCSQQSSNSSVAGNMGRIAGMNDASGESFNFTSIGLNLTSSSTQSTGQEMGVASNAGMPFSFSLTSASTTQTSSSSGSHGQVGHHSFPFYPLHPSVTQPSTTSQQSHQTQSLNMMPPGVDVRMDGQGSGHQTSGPGVGGGMPSTAQNSFNFGGLMDLNSSCSGVRDTAMPNDQSHLMSSVDKSPMASFTQHHGGGAGGGSGTNSGQKRLSEIQPPPPPSNRQPQQPTQSLDHGPPINRSPQQMGNHTSPAGNYFSSSYPSSASLNTPPLRHPPLPNSDSNHLMNRGFDHGFGSSQTSASVPLGGPNFDHHGMSYQRDMNQTRPLEHVSTGASTSSRKPSSQPQQQQQNGGGSKQQKQSQGGGGGSSGLSRVPPSHGQSRNMAPNHSSNQSQQSSAPSQAPPPAHQTSGNGQPPAPSPSQQARQAKRKQPSSQSKKSKPTYSTEIDANLSHSIFDNNQSLQSFFSFQNMSPPPVRNLQSEGPSFLPGNLFGSTSRPLSNSSNKNTPDLGPPYALFPPTRPQNGLGLNFQHSFGMNTMTGNPGSGHMTPHSVAVPPHMGNFSLSNIFSDSGTNDGGINISPIKFSHPGNPILPPQAGMDPNALQHPHQGSALYHNRSHHGQPHVLPNPMTLNSILGHNHHGFDTRSMSQGINSSVGPPFHGAGHPSSFAIPPLNFSMHDH